MKHPRIRLFLLALLSILCANLTCTFAFADANDFYFKSFTADYYLSKDENNLAKMHVVETLIAEFPQFDQNHGITRIIPYTFTSATGTQVIVKNANYKNLNLHITRNGLVEEWFVIEKSASDFTIQIGNKDTYVHGEQTYRIEYDLENVIGEYENTNNQELYWDVNGNGWHQSFSIVNATVRLDDSIFEFWTQSPSCYAGKYGQKGLDRCTSKRTKDEFIFSASNLAPQETLTLNIEFDPGSFTLSETPKSNAYLKAFFLSIALCSLAMILTFINNKNARNNKNLYMNTFVRPEYSPIPNLNLYDAKMIYLKESHEVNVAVLIDMAIRGSIQLVKIKSSSFKNSSWKIKVINLQNTSNSEYLSLQILNLGEKVRPGDEISMTVNSFDQKAALLMAAQKTQIKSSAKAKGLIEKSKTYSILKKFSFIIIIVSFASVFSILHNSEVFYSENFHTELGPFTYFFHIIALIFISIYNFGMKKYSDKTEKAIKLARQLEGLELFMKMTEKDRLAFFQSVENAPVDHQGIVNLYEKLLPYAIFFGLEDSWMRELEAYYMFNDIQSAYWISGTRHMSIPDLSRLSYSYDERYTSITTRPVSSHTSSSFSSSSSSFSGGGGGGFAGGGGGGGGGGGW